MAEPITIRTIINKITSGEIRVPSFQRDFVWTANQVAFLLDSLYKDIPIGNLFFWKTNEKLKIEKDFGNFTLPEPEKDYPVKYVLDGQQRITSLFTVFQDEIEPTKDNHSWIDIYFDYKANESSTESLFVALKKDEVDKNCHFPMKVLFDSVGYREATDGLSREDIKKIDKLQEKFKEVMIPIQEIETDDKGKVAIVFDRINRAGTDLDVFQLITAWSWSSHFDFKEEIEKLADELEKFNFGELSEDKELLLKCCSGVINGKASPDSIASINGEQVRNNFNKIANGIKGAIDFLQRELNISSYKVLPYPSMLVSLTAFFATDKVNGRLYNDKQRKELIKWFWKSCYSRRYSSGVNDKHQKDIENLLALLADDTVIVSNFKCEIEKEFFLKNQFDLSTVNTKVFVITLANLFPRSFISGAKVDLEGVLKNCSRNEFHHIFPKNHLKGLGYENKKINVLGNLCFLNNADNQKIKDKAPSEYKEMLPQESIEEILKSHGCPKDALDLSYEDFLDRRAEISLQFVKTLI